MSDVPRRPSTEPTLVIDIERELSERAKRELARVAETYPELPAADDVVLSEETPSERAEMLGAYRESQDGIATLVRCPVCLGTEQYAPTCQLCTGNGMVTADVAAAWIRRGDEGDET